jgi:hypothetical protein
VRIFSTVLKLLYGENGREAYQILHLPLPHAIVLVVRIRLGLLNKLMQITLRRLKDRLSLGDQVGNF